MDKEEFKLRIMITVVNIFAYLLTFIVILMIIIPCVSVLCMDIKMRIRACNGFDRGMKIFVASVGHQQPN